MRSNRPYNHVTRVLGALVIALSPAGCLVLDEEHCLANGGDLACPGRRCHIETAHQVESITDDLGCSTRDANLDYHVHLKYGLPAEVEMGGSTNLDSLEGILVAVREEAGVDAACRFTSSGLQSELDEVVHHHSKIRVLRERFERTWQVSTSPVKPTNDDLKIIDTYNDAVDDWLDACLATVPLPPMAP